jgi:hypothetical protein
MAQQLSIREIQDRPARNPWFLLLQSRNTGPTTGRRVLDPIVEHENRQQHKVAPSAILPPTPDLVHVKIQRPMPLPESGNKNCALCRTLESGERR